MRAKQRRRLEAKAEALAEQPELHEVQVDADTPPKTTDDKELRSLKALLKGEHQEVNRLRLELKDEKEAHGVSVAYEKKAAEEAIAELKKANETAFVSLYGDLDGQLQVTRDALAELIDDLQIRFIMGTQPIFDAITEAIALRVQTLPQGPWNPKNIAEKIRNRDFEHPHGVRDFYPVIDEHGFPVEVDGEEVEIEAHKIFKKRARRITTQAKFDCRKLHTMKLEQDRPPVTRVMGQPWYLSGYTYSRA